MLEKYAAQGVTDALVRFKLAMPGIPGAAGAAAPGLLDKLKSFGSGQLGAAKDLVGNMRGGFGGKMNPNTITGPVPAHSMDMARGSQRQMALGNLKTLAPTLAVAGGGYMLHRHNQANQQAEQDRQRAMMMQQGY